MRSSNPHLDDDDDDDSCGSSSSQDSFAGGEADNDVVPQLPTTLMITRQNSSYSLASSSDLGTMAAQHHNSPAFIALDVSEDGAGSVGSGISLRSSGRASEAPMTRRGSLSRTTSGRDSMRDLFKAQNSTRSLLSQDSSLGVGSTGGGDPLSMGSSHQPSSSSASAVQGNQPPKRPSMLRSRSRRGLQRTRSDQRSLRDLQCMQQDASVASMQSQDSSFSSQQAPPQQAPMPHPPREAEPSQPQRDWDLGSSSHHGTPRQPLRSSGGGSAAVTPDQHPASSSLDASGSTHSRRARLTRGGRSLRRSDDLSGSSLHRSAEPAGDPLAGGAVAGSTHSRTPRIRLKRNTSMSTHKHLRSSITTSLDRRDSLRDLMKTPPQRTPSLPKGEEGK